VSTSSLAYLAFLVAAVLLFCAGGGPRPRRILFGAVNAAFAAFFVGSWTNAALLAAFVLGGYAAARLAQNRGRGAVPLSLLVSVPVALLLYVKRYAFLSLFLPSAALSHGLEIVGLSYMTFKLIHVVVDAREGALSPLSLPCYANYQLGFFTLAAGPIQRYDDFARWWNEPSPAADEAESLAAWNRILNGILKSALLGTLALKVYTSAFDGVLAGASGRGALGRFLVAFYVYPIFIYLNFSGYCDVVIGSARLFGLTLPENFDSPFLARNMIDFWNRWHISLTFWIRDYVFMTSYKWFAARWNSLRRPAGYVLQFAALLIAGVWHGSTWNFFLFGAFHGLGVAGATMYGDALRRRVGADGVRLYLERPWLRRGAMLLTFHYVCFCFLFFPSDLHKTAAALRAVAAALGRR
jgi:D-alanyl-lipoteichoic acid acyltransferase DltB (MBOAT superfamily)